jgi:catechol 2,3-dioxygenase-like lactoylglutathione lyase family enzyme
MTQTTTVEQGTPSGQGPRLFAGRSAFSSFSTDDLQAAHAFYADRLGVDGRMEDGALTLRFPGGSRVLVYPKDDHEPARFTVLNIEVDDIDAAVKSMTDAGISMERYGPELEQDERGISRTSEGPAIAWFEDPSGNIISVIETHAGPGAPDAPST